nr:hypothetical protein [Saprospiraceae bacterium]
IFALAESPLRQGMIYAGTDDGLIWITEDDGSNWTKFDRFPGVPDMTFVNYVLPSMHDESVVYACFDGRKNSSDFKPYLIKSTDKGRTWTSIAANLPSGTVYCIQEDHVNENILFIGTEWGVWTTIDQGKNWVQLKNGIPPIQVKDLTIQRRENDLVVGTFGRGFYVLEDYSMLRELDESITKKDAHLFAVEDALLYHPANNLNYQGEVHFRSKNPDPEAKFSFWVKDGYETLKQKRNKRLKEAEKNGGTYPYPTEAELLAEATEEKPSLLVTVYDDQDRVIQKIIKPLKKGYQSVNWNLGYLDSYPKVSPGSYKVAIDKVHLGESTRLIEPTAFKVNSIPNALGTPDYSNNFEFKKNVVALNKNLTSARGKINDMRKRLEDLKSMLTKTPVEGTMLLSRINNMEANIDSISKVIMGGFGAKTSAMGRARFASRAVSRAQVNVTGAMQEQYDLAKTAYDSQANVIEQMRNTDLPALEKAFEDAGGVLFTVPQNRRGAEEDKY